MQISKARYEYRNRVSFNFNFDALKQHERVVDVATPTAVATPTTVAVPTAPAATPPVVVAVVVAPVVVVVVPVVPVVASVPFVASGAANAAGVVNMKAIRIAESLCFITFPLFIAWTIRTLEIRIVYFEYNILVKSPFPHTACTIYCG